MRTLLKIKVQDCDHVEAMASMDLDVISQELPMMTAIGEAVRKQELGKCNVWGVRC